LAISILDRRSLEQQSLLEQQGLMVLEVLYRGVDVTRPQRDVKGDFHGFHEAPM
jgi:hypothetical protein